jgi:hypothetical protein
VNILFGLGYGFVFLFLLYRNMTISFHKAHRSAVQRKLLYAYPSKTNENMMVVVEVVLRHFHRSYYRNSPLWFFCGEGV